MYPFFYRVENSTKRGSILSPHVRKVHGKNWPTKLYELCLESHEKLQEDKLEVPEDWNTGDIYLNPKTINALEGVIGTLEAAVDALYDKGPKIPKSKVVKQESSGSINDREKSPPVVGDAGAAGSAAAASPMANRTRSTSASSNNSGRSRSSSNSSNNTLENSSLTAASLAFVVIRPPGHHSHACLPSGFCLLNNVQIAVEYAFDTYNVTHVAILDIDLHHGDGSQDICWERAGFTGDYGKEDNDEEEDLPERNDYGKRFALYPKVGYFSLHDIKSYPTELGFATKDNIRNASTCVMDHDVNIWNVHLQEWTTEEEFYKHYQTKYVAILNRANQFLNQSKKQYDQEQASYLQQLSNYNKVMLKPHLYPPQHVQQLKPPIPPPPFKPLIMISAGFDALEYENPQMQRHGVNVPTSFYATFTKDVVKLAKIHTGGKVISFLEGGYSDGALTTGIFSHLIGLTNDLEMNNLWNDTWGTEQVMKELVKGCKKTWSSYKKPQTDVTIWANEVIKLGRSLMPNCILPANYMYKYVDPQESKIGMSNMVKELQRDNERYATTTIPQVHVEDERRRVTRSYYKKTEGNA